MRFGTTHRFLMNFRTRGNGITLAIFNGGSQLIMNVTMEKGIVMIIPWVYTKAGIQRE